MFMLFDHTECKWLDEYEVGKMERLPTVPEVLAQLPTMEWDDDI